MRREILIEEEPKKLKSLVKKAEGEYFIPIIEYLRHEVEGLAEAAYSKGYELKVAHLLSNKGYSQG